METGLEENGEPDRGGYPRSEEEVEYCGKQDERREDEVCIFDKRGWDNLNGLTKSFDLRICQC